MPPVRGLPGSPEDGHPGAGSGAGIPKAEKDERGSEKIALSNVNGNVNKAFYNDFGTVFDIGQVSGKENVELPLLLGKRAEVVRLYFSY